MAFSILRSKPIIVCIILVMCSTPGLCAEDLAKLDFPSLLARAQSGDPVAEMAIGAHYSKGVGVERDYAKAAEWFQKSADQGNTDAEFALGYLYSRGKGVPLDMAKSVELNRKAAEKGDAPAQTILGLAYRSGTIVKQDPVEAAKWFQRAADQFDSRGQYYLGISYYSGIGVPENKAKAMELIRSSAEQGFMEAECNLGTAFHEGAPGIAKDDIQAYMWLWLSAFQGNMTASAQLKVLESKMSPVDVEKAKVLAHDWKPKSLQNSSTK